MFHKLLNNHADLGWRRGKISITSGEREGHGEMLELLSRQGAQVQQVSVAEGAISDGALLLGGSAAFF